MKLTPHAIMKLINQISEKKLQLIVQEREECVIESVAGQDPCRTSYDYATTRTQIKEYDDQIFRLRSALNYNNATDVIAEIGMTASEALVRMALLSEEKERLSRMASTSQRRQIPASQLRDSSVAVYRIAQYPVDQARKDLQAVTTSIVELQTALDKHNLLTEIDVDVKIDL